MMNFVMYVNNDYYKVLKLVWRTEFRGENPKQVMVDEILNQQQPSK